MQENDARREQMVAAAEALVTWIHARRRTWPDLPSGYTARADTRGNAPLSIAAELTPIAEALGPLRPIAPSPSAVDLVEIETVEPEVIQPPRSRPTWRQVLAVVARALAAVIQALGSALRGFASVLLRVALTGAAVSRPRRRRTAQRARGSRRPLAYAAVLGILLVTGWLARPYWTTIAERISAAGSAAPARC